MVRPLSGTDVSQSFSIGVFNSRLENSLYWKFFLPSFLSFSVCLRLITRKYYLQLGAWESGGFLLISVGGRLISFLRRCVKLGYVEHSATDTDMFLKADDAFFRKIMYSKAHVFHTYVHEGPKIV